MSGNKIINVMGEPIEPEDAERLDEINRMYGVTFAKPDQEAPAS